MSFNSAMKVKEIALSNPEAKRILEDAGIDYCCGGAKSLHEACMHANVPADEVLKRLRENSEQAGSETLWVSAPLADLTRHIREKHHQYVRGAIPRVKTSLEKVKAKHGEKHREIGDIQMFFIRVGQEMIMHMQKEEQILFPYIDAVERAVNEKKKVEPPFFGTVRNPIQAMMSEHDSAGELVKQIRKASSEYTPPADACTSFQALYQDLRQFEEDLHEHVHLENNILFPRAAEMEAAVLRACPTS